MNKFEQLIEYVINDETAKARELFHDIVVEKSRQIYEEMMDEESTHDEDEKAEKAGEKVTKDIEYDDKKDKMDEGMHDMGMEETAIGGDATDDYIEDIEVEEEGMAVEGEGEEMADAELEDRVVDLEDKLDELMAEFEALMGDDGQGDEEVDMDVAMDMDTPDMDAEEVVDDEMETEGMKMPMEEAVNLKAAPAPVKSEEAGINKKSTVAANSGAVGAAAKPVNVDAGGEEKGRTAPQAKDMVGKVQNTPAQGSVKMDAAPKPVTAQASGVNTRTPFPKA